jgi:RNA polymerase sigma-70 factor (ECF subfamily)
MVITSQEKPRGLFDAQYRAFMETVTHVRADLHRYCARMTGSVFDGEDVMQEVLFEAYRNIETLAEPAAVRSWLFSIAHNRCIDFLRKQRARDRAESQFAEDQDSVLPVEPAGRGVRRAVEQLVINLPPKQRACVLLHDVFGYSHKEIAVLVDSTIGGVKVALNRGRAKLAALPDEPAAALARRPNAELLERYVELFNRHDWDGVRALTSDDAKLRVADCFEGRLADSPYFVEYDGLDSIWKMDIAEIDGEIAGVVAHRRNGKWELAHPVRLQISAQYVYEVSDYYACPWVLPAASSVRILHPIATRMERS